MARVNSAARNGSHKAGKERKKKGADIPVAQEVGHCLHIPEYALRACRLLKVGDNINTVFLSGTPDAWELLITEGHFLLCLRGGVAPGQLSAPLDRALANYHHTPPEKPVALKAHVFAEQLALAGKVGNHLGVKISGNVVALARGDGGTTTLQAEGDRCPDWRQCVPKGAPQVRVKLNGGQLAKVLAAIEEMKGADDNMVYLSFFGTDKPLGLVAVTEENQTVDGLIMPLTGKGVFDA